MNIKSFFNGTVLKKDLTRFLPLWVIYLILGLLMVSRCIGAQYDSAAQILLNSLRPFSILLCVYALVTAQMLFGELFSSKLSNAVHALPVRREGLFITHFTAGMLMGIGPMLPSALIASYLGAPAWVTFACLKCDQILKCFVAVVKINRFNWMKNLTIKTAK